MNSPRILMICGDFPPFISGVGDYTDKLCAAMANAGAEVTVLTSTSTDPSDAQRPYTVRRAIDNWSISGRRAVIDHCTSGYDLVQLQYPCVAYGRSPLINLLPSMLRWHRGAPPTVITIHDFRTMRKRWRARVAPMLWSASGLIHVDEQDWPWIRAWGYGSERPRAHIPIAANALPVPCTPEMRSAWRNQLGFSPDETVVAFFGILYPHKGLPELADAVRSLRAAGRKLRLLVLGDFDRHADYRPGMEKMLADPAVRWVQGAPLDEVSRGLHAADIAALPFHSGASTNRGSLLSTLAHGLPTITTSGPCTPADFDKDYAVALVPVNDAKALASEMARLMDDPALRRQMREKALAKSQTWETVAKQSLTFYSTLIHQNSRGHHGARDARKGAA